MPHTRLCLDTSPLDTSIWGRCPALAPSTALPAHTTCHLLQGDSKASGQQSRLGYYASLMDEIAGLSPPPLVDNRGARVQHVRPASGLREGSVRGLGALG